jgi:hypothetical protein
MAMETHLAWMKVSYGRIEGRGSVGINFAEMSAVTQDLMWWFDEFDFITNKFFRLPMYSEGICLRYGNFNHPTLKKCNERMVWYGVANSSLNPYYYETFVTKCKDQWSRNDDNAETKERFLRDPNDYYVGNVWYIDWAEQLNEVGRRWAFFQKTLSDEFDDKHTGNWAHKMWKHWHSHTEYFPQLLKNAAEFYERNRGYRQINFAAEVSYAVGDEQRDKGRKMKEWFDEYWVKRNKRTNPASDHPFFAAEFREQYIHPLVMGRGSERRVPMHHDGFDLWYADAFELGWALLENPAARPSWNRELDGKGQS